jgi:hypothetical protein
VPVVATLRDLDRLEQAPLPMLPGRAVRLELPGLGVDERTAWERRLTRHYAACGCKSGAVTSSAFVVAWIIAALAGIVSVSVVSGIVLLVGTLVASAAGKVVGVAAGRVGLSRAVRDLRLEMSNRS